MKVLFLLKGNMTPSPLLFVSPLHIILKLSTIFLENVSVTAECGLQAQIRQQGEYESLHQDLNVGFSSWEFSPLELKNPFPHNNGSIHIWQGDDDRVVSPKLQRYIAEKLPWIRYHEVSGAGHLFSYADNVYDSVITALLLEEK